ncbi:hypothetical protein GGF46_003281 [Coemansia sp. RSA 552]|nr:hypothetical protein GGF46_003281 [Coemansia sp. RSA 552]
MTTPRRRRFRRQIAESDTDSGSDGSPQVIDTIAISDGNSDSGEVLVVPNSNTRSDDEGSTESENPTTTSDDSGHTTPSEDSQDSDGDYDDDIAELSMNLSAATIDSEPLRPPVQTVNLVDAVSQRFDDYSSGRVVPVNAASLVPTHVANTVAHDLELKKAGRIPASSARMQVIPGKEKLGMMSRQTPARNKPTEIAIPTSATKEYRSRYQQAIRDMYQVPKIISSSPPSPTAMREPPRRAPAQFNGGVGQQRAVKLSESTMQQMMDGLARISVSKEECVDTPAEMTVALKDHQRMGVSWMMRNERHKDRRGGIIGDDMGLGKTIQTLALLVASKPKGGKPHGTLVVAPTSTLSHWRREAETRVQPGLLKVLVYHGSSRYQYARDLSRYDLVVTSFGVMSSEWVGAKEPILRDLNSKQREERDREVLGDSSNGPLFGVVWRRIIVDEAHELKNRTSIRSVACCDLVARYRWCLSGTPIQNSLDDVYPLLRFLRFKPHWHYSNFCGLKLEKDQGLSVVRSTLEAIMLRRNKAAVMGSDAVSSMRLPSRHYYIHRIDISVAERVFYECIAQNELAAFGDAEISSENTIQLLSRLLRLRQTTSHPKVTSSAAAAATALGSSSALRYLCEGHPIELSVDRFWMHLEDAVRNVPISGTPRSFVCGGCGSNMGATDALSVHRCGAFICHGCVQEKATEGDCLQCTRQRPGGYCIADENLELAKYVRGTGPLVIDKPLIEWFGKNFITGSSGTVRPSSKMRRILHILESIRRVNPRDKTVVFSEHLDLIRLLSDYLSSRGFRNITYQGNMDSAKRDKALEGFSKDPNIPVLIISKKTGAVGLNLTSANHVIIESLWWNPAIDSQAVDRIYRIGQTKEVHVHMLIARQTVDEDMFEIQERKRRLINAVISDQSNAEAAKITRDDILDILRHVRPRS